MDTFDMTKALQKLKEREKELNCLYKVNELLAHKEHPLERILKEIIAIIPSGWQYQTVCEARIVFEDQTWQSEDFVETEWKQQADIIIDNNVSGEITVCYTQLIRLENNSQFLPEEQKLLNNIASRLGTFVFNRRLFKSLEALKSSKISGPGESKGNDVVLSHESDEHWKWRMKIAEKIASKVDAERYGIKAFYVIGSTKNANAGPASDIDLLIHCRKDRPNRKELDAWLNGWSLCLSEMNFLKTGHYVKEGLIDSHIITDEDMEKKSSFASMIHSAYDRARPLELRKDN
jgi:hypothetical protein